MADGWMAEAAATVSTAFVPPLPDVASFLNSDVPDLLVLAAKALRRMKLPATYAGLLAMSQSQALDVAPVISLVTVAVLVPFVLLRNEGRLHKFVVPDSSESYWLTRLCLLRGLGLCYLCGFLTSAFQHRALWGSLGLEPVRAVFPTPRPTPVFEYLGASFPDVPFDCALEAVSWAGVLASLLLLWSPMSSCLLPASLWGMYLSIINMQAAFTYSYGWEWLTCEAGFLAIFLCPLPVAPRFPAAHPPPRLVLWLFRWLAFRLLLGAGMSKVGQNSSACWRELTCTTTHYFTQPIPNPASWFAHHAPVGVHRLEVALTFVEQLALPAFMLVPNKWCRRFAGLGEMVFQLLIVATGNYAWINFIGAVPCIALLDDAVLSHIFSRKSVVAARQAAKDSLLEGAGLLRTSAVRFVRLLSGSACVWLVLFMAWKSKDPLRELFSAAPWINNYDKWFLMNSQGVFGFINEHRVQLVLEYTHDESPRGPAATWRPLDFKCIPGTPNRRPCLLSPYHSRLDWETWIRTTASMEHLFERRAPPQEYFNRFPAFMHKLIMNLLLGDEDSVSLIGVPRGELYAGGKPPSAIKARFYSYTFTSWEDRASTGRWWDREPLDSVGGLVFDAAQANEEQREVRRTKPGRTMAMLACVVGLLASVAAAAGTLAPAGGGGEAARQGSATLLALCFIAAFLAALLADYPDVHEAVVRRPLGALGLGAPADTAHPWVLLRALANTACLVAGCNLLAFLPALPRWFRGDGPAATLPRGEGGGLAEVLGGEALLLACPVALLRFCSWG